jgi:hypothetical protein
VKLPDGSVRLIEPPWAGKLSGFTLLFEALVLCLCREMPFAAVARLATIRTVIFLIAAKLDFRTLNPHAA